MFASLPGRRTPSRKCRTLNRLGRGATIKLDSMQNSRRLFIAVALTTVLGCAEAPTKRIAATGRPIQAVRVYVWAATDGALRSSNVERLVQTLQRNGLPVKEFVLLDRPLADLAALDRAWNAGSHAEGATHALVFTRQRLDSFGGANYIRYAAVLWDAESRTLVWQSTLASPANVRGIDAAQRADRLAGDTLRGLSRDKLFELRAQVPRDDAGAEILATHIPLQIR